ncbi:hypothetical protein HGP14_23350 [Rhizobium sp. P32RR-XVIII]|uniref:hypothetical protein n=1 Tax=Rhizobium sp. P32RR-XVIII TaxID=2726738 RepID=UPI0014573335|nr:hypothetical protein [Rhizobium sp. P32RR-XVIII]NLS06265.1 hypothetical protein [Rhizobium sp. P32RR-XVIII]
MPRQPNDEELEQGTYWTPPCEVTITDAHPRLLAALKAGAAIEQVHLFVAGAYDMGSGAPMGQLEVAMDCKRGLACGAFRSIINGEDISGKPAWFACDNDPDTAIQLVLDTARAEGLVL